MVKQRATIYGARGFVGRHLAEHLSQRGWHVRCVPRGRELDDTRDLGHVFYCIGLTADFRTRPFDTVEAHVGLLSQILRRTAFDSFVYASSTRVYGRAASTDEAEPLLVAPAVPDDLYNVSKLMGEALCLGCGRANVRIARLSNVFGPGMSRATFLASVIDEAIATGALTLRTAPESDKDYVAVADVVSALEAIATRGTDPIVNVASGRPTSHRALVDALAAALPVRVTVAPGAPAIQFPPIATARLNALVPGSRRDVVAAIPMLVRQAQAPTV